MLKIMIISMRIFADSRTNSPIRPSMDMSLEMNDLENYVMIIRFQYRAIKYFYLITKHFRNCEIVAYLTQKTVLLNLG